MPEIEDAKNETPEPTQESWLRKHTPVLAVCGVVIAVAALVGPVWLPALKNALNKPAPKAAVTAPVKVTTPTPTPTPVNSSPTPAPTSATPSEPTMALGSTGAAVGVLQARLDAWNIKPQITPDGTFNATTLAAVKAFQTAEKLSADGVVGPATWSALEATPPANSPVISYTVAPIIVVPVATPADLNITVQPAAGGGTAGASWYDLAFANITKHAVTMIGFPTVAAGNNGLQVGTGAVDIPGTTPVLTTIQPGDTAYALLKVTDVGALIPMDEQVATTQLLVMIPNSATQVVVPLSLASAANGAQFLTVYPISLNPGE